MTRSPISYGLGRHVDMEGGGVAELQTDVMRFMAILAFCLVVIFALVQTIPLVPEPQLPQQNLEPVVELEPIPPPPPEKIELPPEPVDLLPVPEPQPEESVSRPLPVQALEAQEAPPVVSEPTRIPTPAPEATEAPPQEIVSEPARDGFTLRFESDSALTRLTARNEVGLYAITAQQALRMNVNRARITFWRASVPNQFHEMKSGTVPEDVITALRRAGVYDAESKITWGVTLPATMSRQLNTILKEHSGGALIIGADGGLRLEQ